nr:M13 family metallopeptidase [Odoribacter sp.]
MNAKFYFPMIALTLLAAGCDQKKESGVASMGIREVNMDTTVSPHTDFFRYACGGWMDSHPLTGEYARFGMFDLLAENNRKQLKSLNEELAAKQSEPGSVAQKIGDLYNMAMDSVKLNTDGMKPIQEELERIARLKDKKELPALVAEMHRRGFTPYFGIYVGSDDKNSAMNIVHTYQDGLSLDEREYYLEDDEHTREIKQKFEQHVARMFRLAGYDKAQAKKAAGDVMKVETRIATASYDNVKLRDPHANYHKMALSELKKEIPGIAWDVYFARVGLKGLKELNVGQPEPLKEVAAILEEMPLEAQKSYLSWYVIDAAADYLSDDFAEQNFDFYGKALSGKLEMQSRWKRSVSTVNGVLGEAVGQMYTEKYFPTAAKERMVTLVGNLQEALGDRIRGLEWMSEETKEKALEKLSAITVKVGYPDKWKDYSALEIKNDSYWENIVRSNVFEYDDMIAKAGKPVDRSKWHMTPQTVNAYYSPSTNEICFPAGILQYPFFDMNADDAFNYGAIGVVIGHEMT